MLGKVVYLLYFKNTTRPIKSSFAHYTVIWRRGNPVPGLWRIISVASLDFFSEWLSRLSYVSYFDSFAYSIVGWWLGNRCEQAELQTWSRPTWRGTDAVCGDVSWALLQLRGRACAVALLLGDARRVLCRVWEGKRRFPGGKHHSSLAVCFWELSERGTEGPSKMCRRWLREGAGEGPTSWHLEWKEEEGTHGCLLSGGQGAPKQVKILHGVVVPLSK